jgi:hypothetical protein
MKPVQNKRTISIFVCPKHKECSDHSFTLDGRPCGHSEHHTGWSKCLTEFCKGFEGVQCRLEEIDETCTE